MNLNQITIPSKNLTVSLAFYKAFGLIPLVVSLPNYLRFQSPSGNSTFSVHLVEELPKGEGTWVYFECERLDIVVSKLKEKGFHFEQDPTNQTWLWREARLKDPDGNQLILYYAGENRLNPPWRIKTEQLNIDLET